MNWLFAPRLRPFLLLAAVASLLLNVAMLVPALYMTWPAIEDFAFLSDDLHVRMSPDGLMAVAIVPWCSTGIDVEGNRFDRPGRATIVLERSATDRPWVGTHTHFSLARGVPQSTFGRREAIR